jgi:ligand-binding sensor domain-containing protein/signal transduction histidine kinase
MFDKHQLNGCRVPVVLFWLLAAVMALCPPAVADSFQVRSWYTENGLPDNTITALAQTPDGYLWVGTPAGLVRFDGESFKLTRAAGYDTALDDSNVVALAVDHRGHLWIASASGLITEFFSGKFQVRYQPPVEDGDRKSAAETVRVKAWRRLNSILAEDAQGRMWAVAIGGQLLRFGEAGEPDPAPMAGFPEGEISGLANDRVGRLWLVKGTNACVFENGQWSICPNGPMAHGGRLLCPAGDDGFWMAWKTPAEAYAYWVQKNGGQWQTTTVPIPTDPFEYPVEAMLRDHLGRLWLALSTEGIYVQSPGKDWTRVQTRGPLKKNSARCLFEDREGGIWVGTWDEGLHQILDPLVQMAMLPPEAANVHATSVSWGRKDEVWMGTDDGLYWQGPNNAAPAKVDGFQGENVYSVLADSRGQVWAGARSGIYLRTNNAFAPVALTTNGGFLTLFEDRAGDVWAGGFHNALYHFHDRTNDFVCAPPTNGNGSVCCLAQDHDGKLWVLTRGGGLWWLDGRQLKKVPGAGVRISANGRATAVVCDESNTLWISSMGGGLFRWNNGRLQHFSTANGLPDNGIVGMEHDRQGNLWLSSRDGIFGCPLSHLNDFARFRAPPLVFMQLGVAEGMADRECMGAGQPVIASGPDGQIAVATTVGVAKFDPAAVARSGATPEVFIESLNVDGRVTANPNVRAPGNSLRFEFQYGAPELISPHKLRFRYRLEGLEPGWTEGGKARTAIYNRLPPGRYRFNVEVCGQDGVWREAKRQIDLQVVPLFWQTWWFQLLVVLAIIGLISGAVVMNIRRRMQRSVERLEAQRAVEQVRQRITRDLHDELGSAITEIIQTGDLTLFPNPAPDLLRSKMNVIMTRVQQLSVTVDEIVWTTSSRNDTLRSLVGYLSNHAQEFFRHSPIRCRLDVSANLPEVVMDSQRRHNLYLATKEALNNAAKHSGATEVVLRAHYASPVLRIAVEDNGRGFAAGSERNGDGLLNMRERLAALNGTATFASPPGGGTVVLFTVELNPGPETASAAKS